MKNEFYQMDIPAAASPSFGSPMVLKSDYDVTGVQLFLDGGTGAIVLQGSYDGSNYANLHTAVNSNGITILDVKGMYSVRVAKTTDFAGNGGEEFVRVCAKNIRED